MQFSKLSRARRLGLLELVYRQVVPVVASATHSAQWFPVPNLVAAALSLSWVPFPASAGPPSAAGGWPLSTALLCTTACSWIALSSVVVDGPLDDALALLRPAVVAGAAPALRDQRLKRPAQ